MSVPPNHPTSDYFSIETGDLGIPQDFEKKKHIRDASLGRGRSHVFQGAGPGFPGIRGIWRFLPSKTVISWWISTGFHYQQMVISWDLIEVQCDCSCCFFVYTWRIASRIASAARFLGLWLTLFWPISKWENPPNGDLSSPGLLITYYKWNDPPGTQVGQIVVTNTFGDFLKCGFQYWNGLLFIDLGYP